MRFLTAATEHQNGEVVGKPLQRRTDVTTPLYQKVCGCNLGFVLQLILTLYLQLSMTTWEYKQLRFDFKGRGITQELNILDIDGERTRGWGENKEVPTLPEMLTALGQDGWEMVSHMVNQDNSANGVTFHYLYFKRPVQ